MNLHRVQCRDSKGRQQPLPRAFVSFTFSWERSVLVWLETPGVHYLILPPVSTPPLASTLHGNDRVPQRLSAALRRMQCLPVCGHGFISRREKDDKREKTNENQEFTLDARGIQRDQPLLTRGLPSPPRARSLPLSSSLPFLFCVLPCSLSSCLPSCPALPGSRAYFCETREGSPRKGQSKTRENGREPDRWSPSCCA